MKLKKCLKQYIKYLKNNAPVYIPEDDRQYYIGYDECVSDVITELECILKEYKNESTN